MATIREGTADDAMAVGRVLVESWRATYRGLVPDLHLDGLNNEQQAERWRKFLSTRIRMFVAEEAGEVVGFAGGGKIRRRCDDYDAELYALYLLPDAQRKGTGSALLKALARRLVEEGFRSLMVWVVESNSAVRFYEKSGAVRFAAEEMEIEGGKVPLVAYGWREMKQIVGAD